MDFLEEILPSSTDSSAQGGYSARPFDTLSALG